MTMAKSAARESKTLGLVVLGGALIGAAVFLAILVTRANNASKASNWPSAQGQVLEGLDIREKRLPGSARSNKSAIEYDILFEYAVDGKTYQSERFSFHPDEMLLGFRTGYVRDLQERFTVGKPITVRYDPLDPARSVVSTKVPLGLWLSIAALGTLIVALAIIIVIARLYRGVLPSEIRLCFQQQRSD